MVGGVRKTDHLMHPFLSPHQAGRGDEKWHVNVFLAEKERVTIIPFMLMKGLAVIAVNHPNRVLLRTSRAQPFDERDTKSLLPPRLPG
jgi:hypothetical protein